MQLASSRIDLHPTTLPRANESPSLTLFPCLPFFPLLRCPFVVFPAHGWVCGVNQTLGDQHNNKNTVVEPEANASDSTPDSIEMEAAVRRS